MFSGKGISTNELFRIISCGTTLQVY